MNSSMTSYLLGDQFEDQFHPLRPRDFKQDLWSEKVNGEICLHRSCPDCGGSGVKKRNGQSCVHMISCPCSRCSPRMSV